MPLEMVWLTFLKWVWLTVENWNGCGFLCALTVPSYLPGKTDHVQWHTWTLGRRVEEWHTPTKPQVSPLPIATWTVEWLSARHQIVLTMFLGFRSRFRAVQKECATSPHIHPMSNDIAHDQFYLAFPCTSIATNKRWGEKAWVWGYLMAQ